MFRGTVEPMEGRARRRRGLQRRDGVSPKPNVRSVPTTVPPGVATSSARSPKFVITAFDEPAPFQRRDGLEHLAVPQPLLNG